MTAGPSGLDIDRLYETEIGPGLEVLEEDRQKALKTFKIRAAIAVPIALALGAGFFLLADRDPVAFVMGVVMAGVVGGWVAYQPLEKVSHESKAWVLNLIASALELSYTAKDFAPPWFDRFSRYGCLPNYDRSSFEDMWTGRHRGRGFTLYEAHLEEKRRGNKGRTYWVTVFRGQLIRMDLTRPLLSTTVLKRDAGLFNALSAPGKEFKRVGFPSSVFEKAFEAWSTDQVEARYVLDPLVLEKLIDLEKRMEGGKLRAIFEEDAVYFMVEGKNLFEIGSMFEALPNPERARRIASEMEGIWAVMDVLADRSRAQTADNS